MKRQWLCVLGLLVLLPFTALASNKAGLVVQNSAGDAITRCVEFEEEAISVEELLIRSGFKLLTEETSLGTTVLYIHDDGVQPGESHPDGWFWNFYQHDGTDWVMANAGVSSIQATDGTIFGFVFGAWGEIQPPRKTFADVCETVSIAGVVIDHNDGSRVVRVVEFFGETLTGYQLLQKSDLDLVTKESALGISLCSIDGEGMPFDKCFDDPEGRYWGFTILADDDTWSASQTGSADTVVRNNDVHGYFYAVWGAVQLSISRMDILGQPSSVADWASLR